MADVCPAAEDARAYNYTMRMIGLGVLVFVAVFYPATIYWWYTRRNHLWLKKRSFWLMMTSALGQTFHFVTGPLLVWNGRENFPCDAFLILVYLLPVVTVGPIVVRLVKLQNSARYNNYLFAESGKGKIMRDLSRFNGGSQGSKFSRLVAWARIVVSGKHRKRNDSGSQALSSLESGRRSSGTYGNALFFSTTSAFSVLSMAVFIAVALIIIFVFMADETRPYGFKGCTACVLDGRDFVPQIAEGGIVFVVGCGLLWRVRNLPDPLGIVAELKILWVCGLFVAMGMTIGLLDPGGLDEKGEFYYIYIATLGALMVHIVMCPIQVLRTYDAFRPSKLAALENAGENGSLEYFLEDNDAREVFARHLQQELSMENMLFLQAVSAYKRDFKPGSEQSRSQAIDIYEAFLQDGSMLQVNISASARRSTQEQLFPEGRRTTGRGGYRGTFLGRKTATPPQQRDRRSNNSEELVPVDDLEDDIFRIPENEIRNLLSSDSLPRFLRSNLYKQFTQGTLKRDKKSKKKHRVRDGSSTDTAPSSMRSGSYNSEGSFSSFNSFTTTGK